MHRPTGIGARLALVVIGVVLLALAAPALAQAADVPAEKVIHTAGPIIPLDCKNCHANISDTKLPNIKFSHAAHIVYACDGCHSRFPHQPEGTTVPGKKDCWNCHALRHGPQGIMAKAECEKCHIDDARKRRPKFHVADWKARPHVKPGVDQLQTLCMMCHDRAWCDDCHLKDHIYWVPDKPFTFDSNNGCMACHGSELPRLTAPVSGLDASAHRTTATCQQCHIDFKYFDGEDASKLWKVNAGLACRTCHVNDPKNPARVAIVKQADSSIHAQRFAEGKLTAPTCAGCHGGHDIERTKTDAAKRRLYLSGEKMCGAPGCHADTYASYNDYYHGAAYKKGATDAPACWTCHGAHSIYASKDPTSAVNLEKLAATCGKGANGKVSGCHEGTQESFAEAAAPLIHRALKARQDNPVQKIFNTVFSGGQ
ncbi:MAG TPA: hypothetical protein VF902_06135 [Coriobacteriia bacterium]